MRLASLLPLVLLACGSSSEPSPGPLEPVLTVPGDDIVQVLPGGNRSVVTVHDAADGVWLVETTFAGEELWRERVVGDNGPVALADLTVVPARYGFVFAYPERGLVDEWLVVKRHRAYTYEVARHSFTAEQRVEPVGLADLQAEGTEVFVRVDDELGQAQIRRLRTGEVDDLADEDVLVDWPADRPILGVQSFAMFGFAVLGALDGQTLSMRVSLFDMWSDVRLPVAADEPTWLIGNSGLEIYSLSQAGDGALTVHRTDVLRKETHSSPVPPDRVAIDRDLNRASEIVLDTDGYTLVDDRFDQTRHPLGNSLDLRVDEMHIVGPWERAVLGARLGVEGVFVYEVPQPQD